MVLVNLQVLAFEYVLMASKVNENVYYYFGKPEVIDKENNANVLKSCFVDLGWNRLFIDSNPSYM